MESPSVSNGPRPIPRKVTLGLVIGWILIAIKCAAAPYVMVRWSVPVDPGWVVVPTLIFAVLITWLILSRDWSSSDD